MAALLAFVVAVALPVGVQAQKDKDKKETTAGIVFEIYKDKGDHFRYRIKQGDVHLGMSSKGYESKDDLMKVITTIQKEAAKAKIVEEKGKDK
jgi:uncharacterized protein YegP (UPF0339 family)